MESSADGSGSGSRSDGRRWSVNEPPGSGRFVTLTTIDRSPRSEGTRDGADCTEDLPAELQVQPIPVDVWNWNSGGEPLGNHDVVESRSPWFVTRSC